MDPLSHVLKLLRPESYAIRGLDAGGDWSIAFPAGEGIKCYALQSGTCWLAMDGLDQPVQIVAGDCVLLPRGHAFRFYSKPDAPSIDAIPLFSAFEVGTVAVVNGGGNCRGLGGYFTFTGLYSDLLLTMLPTIVHFQRDTDKDALRWYLERLMQELHDPHPGGVLIAQHLAQTILIQALRLHVLDDSRQGVGWLFALRDRQMSAVLAAIHDQPGQSWTLESLAALAGMSRSSFAARFNAMVGESAIGYLTRWRMHLAADRLCQFRTPVSVLADTLGYASESAFGAAFKRVIGQSPRVYLNQVATNHNAVSGI